MFWDLFVKNYNVEYFALIVPMLFLINLTVYVGCF